MPTTYATVDDYIAAAPPERQATLTQLRQLIREVAPEATESISYNMPAYDYHGMFCGFAAQKHYFSLYVLDGTIVNTYRPQLAGLSVGKSCIRFKTWSKLPVDTIRAMLQDLAASNRKQYNDHC